MHLSLSASSASPPKTHHDSSRWQLHNTLLIPIPSQYAKNCLHLPQTFYKNLKIVSGRMKLYTDVCSHFWLPTSADIFVAPVSKLSSVYLPQPSLVYLPQASMSILVRRGRISCNRSTPFPLTHVYPKLLRLQRGRSRK